MVNEKGRDFTEWMYRFRRDAPGRVRLEIYTVPGWAYKLREWFRDRGIAANLHGSNSIRIKGQSLVQAIELLAVDVKLVELVQAVATQTRHVRSYFEPSEDLERAVRLLLFEDCQRHV